MLLSSCSVKSDRSDCPCWVTVVTDTDSDCIVSFYDAYGNLQERRVLDAGQLRTGDNYTRVRRGELYVSVLEGADDMLLDGGHVVRCREGHQSGRIRCFTERASAVGDNLTVTGRLHKKHAVVTLLLVNSEEPVYPYDVSIQSSLSGMDLLSLEAVSGNFHYEPEVTPDCTAGFVITRQSADQPLNMFLLEKRTGVVLATIDLNTYIAKTGYSWDTEELGDVTITVDFSKSSITVFVADWDAVYIYSFEI